MLFHFILVTPGRGENVGFAARAMKTMGFNSLRFAGTPSFEEKAARKTAYGAHDILDRAQSFTDLKAATQDLDLTVGTTSKTRIKRYDYHDPGSLSMILKNKGAAVKSLGLIFGSEENGLSTEQLDICHLVSTIPLATDYPSLNLAQSVLIYAWELAKVQKTTALPQTANMALQSELRLQALNLLDELHYDNKPLLRQRIMDRVMIAGADDMELMVNLLQKLKRRITSS